MNTFSAWGRLTADPKARESQAGNRYTRFCLASTRSRSDPSGRLVSNLFDCWCFAPHLVQVVTVCLQKGDHVFISGEIEIDQLEGRIFRPRVIVQNLARLPDGRQEGEAEPHGGAWPRKSPIARMAGIERDLGDPISG